MMRMVDINRLRNHINHLPDAATDACEELIIELAKHQSKMRKLELRQYELRDAIWFELKKEWSLEELNEIHNLLNLGPPSFV